MSEENIKTEDVTTTEATTENVEKEIPTKVVFKDKIEIKDSALSISGGCPRCGERFSNVKAVNGKVTCPNCNFII